MSLRDKLAKLRAAFLDVDAELGNERALDMWSAEMQLDDILIEQNYGWVRDILMEGEQVFAISANNGHLYKTPFTVDNNTVNAGPTAEVVHNYQEVDRSFKVYKERQADGSERYRYAGIACTAVLNRVGEIDSTELFDSFLERIESGEAEYPLLDLYHTGQSFTLGRADTLVRDGVVYYESGLFDDNDIARAFAEHIMAAADTETPWGFSIAYMPDAAETMVVGGFEVPVFTRGTHMFTSLLAESDAAALFTNVQVRNNSNMASEKITQLLNSVLGTERAAAELAKIDQVNRSVSENNLVHRNNEETGGGDDAPADDAGSLNIDDDDMAALAAEVKDELAGDFAEKSEVETLAADLAASQERAAKLEAAAEKRETEMAQLRSRLDALEGQADENQSTLGTQRSGGAKRKINRTRSSAPAGTPEQPAKVDFI